MRNALRMMKLVWPNGIPTEDYKKALNVIEMADGSTQQTPEPAPEPTNDDKVRAALATGPATARELSEVTGLSVGQVKGVLARIATSSGTRPNPNGFGIAANVYTLKKGA